MAVKNNKNQQKTEKESDFPAGGTRALEDRQLIEKAQKGDQKGFEKLLSKYRKSVYYLILKMVRNPHDAEDLTQDAFAKAFASLEKYDSKFAFSTWLFRIASNSCIDFIRKQKMQLYSIDTPTKNADDTITIIEIHDKDLIAYEKIIRQQRKDYLELAIADLPSKYQELIRLRYFKEFSYEEISQIVKLPLGTVKAQLHRAREILAEILAKSENRI